MSLLIGAITIGLILALLALGIFISFRIFNFPDITAEGSITLGAAISASMIASGFNPMLATVVALAGDGGFLFTIQELATAVDLGLPLAIVIWQSHWRAYPVRSPV